MMLRTVPIFLLCTTGLVFCNLWSAQQCTWIFSDISLASFHSNLATSNSSVYHTCSNFTRTTLSLYFGMIDLVCNWKVRVKRECQSLRVSGRFSLTACRAGTANCSNIPRDYTQKLCALSQIIDRNSMEVCWYSVTSHHVMEVADVLCQNCPRISVTMETLTTTSQQSEINFAATYCPDVVKRALKLMIELPDFFHLRGDLQWLHLSCDTRSFVTNRTQGFQTPTSLFRNIQSLTCLLKSKAAPLSTLDFLLAGNIAKTYVNNTAFFMCSKRVKAVASTLPMTTKSTTEIENVTENLTVTLSTTTITTTTTTTDITTTTTTTDRTTVQPGQFCDLPVIPENVFFDSLSFECELSARRCRRNATITFGCHFGHGLIGPSQIRCHEAVNHPLLSEWNAPVPSCGGCDIPDVPDHSSYTVVGDKCSMTDNKCAPSGSLQYNCDQGYTSVGTSNITCIASSPPRWNAPPPFCTSCDLPAVPENGMLAWVSFGCVSTVRKCSRGAFAQFGCFDGFKASGPTRITCVGEQRLSWDNQAPICQACKIPDAPAIGTISEISQDHCNTDTGTCSDGGYIRFSCPSGYSPEGSGTITCMSSNTAHSQFQWDRPVPRCMACNIPLPPQNGAYDFLSVGCNMAAGKCGKHWFIQFGCHLGYTPIGPSRITCRETADRSLFWDNPVPRCSGCDIPQAPDHGSVLLSIGCDALKRTCARNWYAQYQCEPGYRLNGPAILICVGNSTLAWDNTRPSCIPQ